MPTLFIRAGLVTAALALIATGCGPASSNNSAPQVTVTQTTTAPASDPATTPAETPTTETPTTQAPRTPAAKPASNLVTVPNGVGKDYQTAQDLWRAAGLHVMPAHDATGAHRLPIIDSNWVVLSQDLKAGTKVARDSWIQASVKKFTDG